MAQVNQTSASQGLSIDPATQVGIVTLAVADLARSVEFYTKAIGFAIIAASADETVLGAGGTPLLRLTEERGARAWPQDQQGYTGLYHFAILVPSRAALGQWLRQWVGQGHPLPGQGDHLVSEALYLTDPDGNGIEVYRDRPRDQWTWRDGQVVMATDPVDIRGVLDAGDHAETPWAGMPAGTRVGHIHLQVGDIPTAAEFYHGVLGFDIVAQMPSALFISAGGYHHHIGMNIWHSRGAGHAPAGFAGLRRFTIDFASQEARSATVARIAAAGIATRTEGSEMFVDDPWQNTMHLRLV